MKCIAIGVAVSAFVASTASADLTWNFDWYWASGQMSALAGGPGFDETISGITLDVTTLNSNSTAEDFAIYIADSSTVAGGPIQMGGWNSLGAASWHHTSGEVNVLDTMTFDTPITFTGTNLYIWIGCTEGNQGFMGSITLHTVAAPAPGAVALLGLAGLAARRRRR